MRWSRDIRNKDKGIKLDAAIDPEALKSAETGEEIISCIESSKGEITLAERDVNEYFASGEAASGFSGLAFDFTPKGYKAKGRFEAELLVLKLDLDLKPKESWAEKRRRVPGRHRHICRRRAPVRHDNGARDRQGEPAALVLRNTVPGRIQQNKDDERRGDDVRQSRQSQNRRKLELGKVRKTKCSKKSGPSRALRRAGFFCAAIISVSQSLFTLFNSLIFQFSELHILTHNFYPHRVNNFHSAVDKHAPEPIKAPAQAQDKRNYMFTPIAYKQPYVYLLCTN